MSIKQEEYSFYYKVKNESARKRLGFKAGFFWCTAKKQSLALSVANWLWMLPDLMKLILPDLYAYIFR